MKSFRTRNAWLCVLAAIAGLSLGCSAGWLYWDVTVDWVDPPPIEISSDMDYPVTVAVAGGISVEHVNIHWSTTSDPRYYPEEETTAQAGPPGQFNFVLNLHSASATTYYIAIHAVVNGGNYYNDVMPITVKAGPPYVTWDTLPPDPMTAGTDYSVQYTVTGGTTVSSARVQWTSRGNPSSLADGWTSGNSGVPGTFTDTVNIAPSSDTVYRMCVKAIVDGDTYFSPIVSRLVEFDGPVDPYEDNDLFADAYYLGGSGFSGTISAYIYPGGDSDYFWLSSGSGTLSIDLTSLPADYDLFLYDDAYDFVRSSTQAGTTDESISEYVLSGTYYVVVRGYNEAFAESAYSLTVDIP